LNKRGIKFLSVDSGAPKKEWRIYHEYKYKPVRTGDEPRTNQGNSSLSIILENHAIDLFPALDRGFKSVSAGTFKNHENDSAANFVKPKGTYFFVACVFKGSRIWNEKTFSR